MKTKLLLIVVTVVAFTAAPAGASSISRVTASLDAVGADLDAVSAADTAYDLAAMGVACNSLGDDTSSALTLTRPSRVNRTSWHHIIKAWSLLNQAAMACVSGADNNDDAAINRSTDLITRSNHESKLATATL